MEERPVSRVPPILRAGLAAALALQIGWRLVEPAPTAHARGLPPPPRAEAARVYALGEPVPLAQMMTLYLQAFDTQPGISIPFRDLDYGRVLAWLGRILDLDPDTQYPLLMATHVYSQVPDPERTRAMLEFAYRRFLDTPDRHWAYLAHASIVARHRLRDLPLALRYADAIATHATGAGVPSWARQMHIFLLEEMGEVERATILLGGLLDSGAVTDPQEVRFLTGRLDAMKRRAGVISSDSTKN